MANMRRIPFVLNLDDPVDAAIWDVLKPMLDRRRASQFIRGAVAQMLGIDGFSPSVPALSLPKESTLALSPGPLPKAKRPTQAKVAKRDQTEIDGGQTATAEAMGNFLTTFG